MKKSKVWFRGVVRAEVIQSYLPERISESVFEEQAVVLIQREDIIGVDPAVTSMQDVMQQSRAENNHVLYKHTLK